MNTQHHCSHQLFSYYMEGEQLAYADLIDMSYNTCLEKAEDLLSTSENERDGDLVYKQLVNAYADTILSFESIPTKPFISPNWRM